MKVVIDANRVMSALIKDSATRRRLMTTDSILYAPGFIRTELAKHRTYLLKKSGLSPADYDQLLAILLSKIRWVPDDLIIPHIARAAQVLKDPDDLAYLAAALTVGADAIWTEDKGFDEQKLIPRTSEPDRIRT